MVRLFVGIFLLLGFAFATNAVHADRFLQQHLDAIGGIEAVSAIRTVHRKGVVSGQGLFGQYRGTAEEWLDLASGRIYSVSQVGTYKRENVWDGETGWGLDTQAGKMDWSRSEAAVTQILAAPFPLVMLSKQVGLDRLQLGDATDFHGEKCRIVTVVDSQMQLFVNPETHLLEGIRIPQTLDVIYSDYDEVDGVRLAITRELTLKAEGTVTVHQFRDTRLNVDLKDNLFLPPEKRDEPLPKSPDPESASYTGKQLIQFLDRDGNERISKEEATAELKSSFQFVDKDGDGTIDLKEANAIAAYGRKQNGADSMSSDEKPKSNSGQIEGVGQLMHQLDMNHDEFIVWEEAPEDLRLFFDDYDENGDGRINRKEARSIVDYLTGLAKPHSASTTDPNAGDVTAEQLIKQMDRNGDGVIDKDEAPGELKAGFSSVDTNRDDVIDIKEARAIADYLNRQ